MAAVGDFNQDGKSDIVWCNPTTGENYVFVIDGLAVQGTSGYLPAVPGENWQIAGVSDVDGWVLQPDGLLQRQPASAGRHELANYHQVARGARKPARKRCSLAA